MTQITDIYLTTGTILSSDEKEFRKDKSFKQDFCKYLPYWTFSKDKLNISLQAYFHEEKNRHIQYDRKKRTSAVNYRFLRIFSEDGSWVKLMILDIDSPGQHELWMKAKIPRPNSVVINPVSLNCQYIYFLSEVNTFGNRDTYWNIRYKLLTQLKVADPKSKVDFCKAYNYRSPYFFQGRREGTFTKRGKKQAPYHYVILHHEESYSLASLNVCGGDLMSLDWTPSTDALYTNRYSKEKGTSSKKGASSRHMDMVHRASFEAKRSYDPKLSDEDNIQRMYSIFESHADPTLPKSQIKASATCMFKQAQKSYDPSKKGSKNADRTSERQRYRIHSRWNDKRYPHELDIDAARRIKVTRQTIITWKKQGKLELRGREYVKRIDETLVDAAKRLEKSYKTLKRWKASRKIELIDGLWAIPAAPNSTADRMPTANEPEAAQSQPMAFCASPMTEIEPEHVGMFADLETRIELPPENKQSADYRKMNFRQLLELFEGG